MLITKGNVEIKSFQYKLEAVITHEYVIIENKGIFADVGFKLFIYKISKVIIKLGNKNRVCSLKSILIATNVNNIIITGKLVAKEA